jgi:hypothetical protein
MFSLGWLFASGKRVKLRKYKKAPFNLLLKPPVMPETDCNSGVKTFEKLACKYEPLLGYSGRGRVFMLNTATLAGESAVLFSSLKE